MLLWHYYSDSRVRFLELCHTVVQSVWDAGIKGGHQMIVIALYTLHNGLLTQPVNELLVDVCHGVDWLEESDRFADVLLLTFHSQRQPLQVTLQTCSCDLQCLGRRLDGQAEAWWWLCPGHIRCRLMTSRQSIRLQSPSPTAPRTLRPWRHRTDWSNTCMLDGSQCF